MPLKSPSDTIKKRHFITNMKLHTVLSIVAFAAFGLADAADDAQFLTAFVSDFASNRRQYVNYFMTAKSIPSGLTLLALEVATYTDDSYTTLVEDPALDITSLKSFATGLPWYSRINVQDVDSGSSGGASGASTSLSSRSSSSSEAGAMSFVAPGGALMGAVALILL